MSENITEPEPRIDPDPDEGNAAGGTDAVSDRVEVPPLVPDPPRSAQVDEETVPDEIKQPEESDQDDEPVSGEGETTSEPSA